MNDDKLESFTSHNDKGESIKRELKKYSRYWIWFALGIAICLFASYMYLRYTPRVFTSSAKIKILNKTKGLELPSAAFVFNRSNINLENEMEILKSYRIIEQVVDTLDLTMSFYEEGNVRTSEIDKFPFTIVKTIDNFKINSSSYYTIKIKEKGFEVYNNSLETPLFIPDFNSYTAKHNFPFEIKYKNKDLAKSDVGKSYILTLTPISSATRSLKSRISVSMLGKGSDLIQIGFSSESKQKSERIINTLIDVFNRDGIIDRQEISMRTIKFIDDRFKYLAFELDSVETNLKEFKQENDFLSFDSSSQIELVQRTESENQVFQIESQIMLSDLLKEELENTSDEPELLPSNIGLASGDVNGYISRYNDLIQERKALALNAGENNPLVKVIDEKLKDVRGNMDESLNLYEQQLMASKNLYTGRSNKFANEVASIPLKEKLLNSIERQQVIKETLYLFLLQKREEAAINLAITEPSIKVVEYALSGAAPISPSSNTIYLFGLVAGFFIPFSFIYAINLLDTKIKGRSDVEAKVRNVPILAELPIIRDRELVFSDPTDNTAQAEAFRILSSNVNYILPSETGQLGKVIYCTSTIKGEGKTYTAVNLSLALSSMNKKVLLVGADLRNPQIHNYLSKDYGKDYIGLSNYLYDDTFNWEEALISGFDKHPNHNIIVSGTIPPNPAQLLTNGKFERFLEEAKQQYDYVVVDTAPTILVTDTTLISKFADATIYLIRADFTEKKLLEYSKKLNDTGRLQNMAYVVNGVGASKSYGYGYNYGYSYGYGNSEGI